MISEAAGSRMCLMSRPKLRFEERDEDGIKSVKS
jgi:hypothetical protein